jgi:hypothetical protein
MNNLPPVTLIVGCICVYPVVAFVLGILFERYRRRYRVVRIEPKEGREV